MPLDDAILASKGLLNHASKDDLTPAINGGSVVEHEGKRYLIATDRFSIGRFELGDLDTLTGDAGRQIPYAALVWISKVVRKSLRRAAVKLDLAEGGYGLKMEWSGTGSTTEVAVSIIFDGKSERSQTFDVTPSPFPPVIRLWRPAGMTVNPLSKIALSVQSLTKIAEDVKLFEHRDGATTLNLHSGDGPTGKPAPVEYTVGTRWAAIIQPNLMVR
jgi:hypothetical protein